MLSMYESAYIELHRHIWIPYGLVLDLHRYVCIHLAGKSVAAPQVKEFSSAPTDVESRGRRLYSSESIIGADLHVYISSHITDLYNILYEQL